MKPQYVLSQIKESEKIAKAIIVFVETFNCDHIDQCKDCLLSIEIKSPDGNEDHDHWTCLSNILKRSVIK